MPKVIIKFGGQTGEPERKWEASSGKKNTALRDLCFELGPTYGGQNGKPPSLITVCFRYKYVYIIEVHPRPDESNTT